MFSSPESNRSSSSSSPSPLSSYSLSPQTPNSEFEKTNETKQYEKQEGERSKDFFFELTSPYKENFSIDSRNTSPKITHENKAGNACDWGHVNMLLRRNGFTMLPLSEKNEIFMHGRITPKEHDVVFQILNDILIEYERRGKVVQDLVLGQTMKEQGEDQTEKEVTNLKIQNKDLHQQLYSIESKLLEYKESITALTRQKDELSQISENTVSSLKMKFNQVLQQCRTKELQIQKLTEHLQSMVRKEESRRASDLQVYEQIISQQEDKAKTKSNITRGVNGVNDKKALRVVSLLEAHRKSSQDELQALRREVHTLNETLRDKENELQSMRLKFNGKKNLNTKKEENIASQKDRELQDTKRELNGILEEMEKLKSENIQLTNRLRNLVDNSKVKQFKQLTEDETNENQENMGNAWIIDMKSNQKTTHKNVQKENSEFESQQVTTRIKILRDKHVHNNSLLNKIRETPQSIAVELLIDICLSLQITQTKEILPILNKISLVLSAVPRMESFIAEICDLVGGEFSGLQKPRTEEIIPLLKTWKESHENAPLLHQFFETVFHEISQRSPIQIDSLTVFKNIETHNKHANDSPPNLTPQLLKDTVDTIHDMVQNEIGIIATGVSLLQANTYITTKPQLAIHQMIIQIMNVLGVNGIESLVPRINQIAIQLSEMKREQNEVHHVLGVSGFEPRECVVKIEKMVKERNEAEMLVKEMSEMITNFKGVEESLREYKKGMETISELVGMRNPKPNIIDCVQAIQRLIKKQEEAKDLVSAMKSTNQIQAKLNDYIDGVKIISEMLGIETLKGIEIGECIVGVEKILREKDESKDNLVKCAKGVGDIYRLLGIEKRELDFDRCVSLIEKIIKERDGAIALIDIMGLKDDVKTNKGHENNTTTQLTTKSDSLQIFNNSSNNNNNNNNHNKPNTIALKYIHPQQYTPPALQSQLKIGLALKKDM